MTQAQIKKKTMGVPKQTEAKAGQTKLIVTLENGKEFSTFCETEKVNDTARMIKKSLQGVVSVKMVTNE
jgi:hypothetical protein